MTWLPPGVDDEVFFPGAGGPAIRAKHGLGERPVVVCVSRLVPRKGQDVLLRAWPLVLRAVPDAMLLLVGGGPYRSRLERLVDAAGVRRSVILTGSVPWTDLPAYYDAGNVFAMPCRTRAGGLDVEGLGIVFLEASATGLPVVAGNSGGAPDAVLDGETGFVVDGRSVESVADRVTTLLLDPARAQEMGKRGRQWVSEAWRWDDIAQRLTSLLDLVAYGCTQLARRACRAASVPVDLVAGARRRLLHESPNDRQTATTITAAMAAMRSPYSTADAPSSRRRAS